MGKAEKHTKDWKETKLEIIVDMTKFVKHSVKIMQNRKVFRPEDDFNDMLLTKVYELCLNIFYEMQMANEINPAKDPGRLDERIKLEKSVIDSMNVLLRLFDLVKTQFHIKGGKFFNWMKMLVDLERRTESWHKSTLNRFVKCKNKDNLAIQDGCRLNLSRECSSAVC